MEELRTVWEYIRAVGKHWVLIIASLGLTVVDFVERIFGTWFVFPLWFRLTIGISGLTVAQYLAYRDFVKAKYERLTDEQIDLITDNENLRYANSQLEKEIDRLTALEEARREPPISPQEQRHRQLVSARIRELGEVGRHILRCIADHGQIKALALNAEYDFGEAALNEFFQRTVPESLVIYENGRVSLNPELKPAIEFVLASQYGKD